MPRTRGSASNAAQYSSWMVRWPAYLASAGYLVWAAHPSLSSIVRKTERVRNMIQVKPRAKKRGFHPGWFQILVSLRLLSVAGGWSTTHTRNQKTR
jgi:hypothetical protein